MTSTLRSGNGWLYQAKNKTGSDQHHHRIRLLPIGGSSN